MLQSIGTFLAAPENFLWTALIFIALMAAFWALYTFVPRMKPYRGQLLVITFICLFTLLLFLCTYSFRVKKIMKYTNAATMPRTWVALMVPVIVLVVVSLLNGSSKPDEPFKHWQLALGIGVAVFASVFLFDYIGYYLSSALFLVLMMWLMKERKVLRLVLTPVCWCLFTWLVFDKLLFIKLPVGQLFQSLGL